MGICCREGQRLKVDVEKGVVFSEFTWTDSERTTDRSLKYCVWVTARIGAGPTCTLYS